MWNLKVCINLFSHMSEPCMPPAQQSRSDMAAHMAHLGLLESCILVLWQKNSPWAPTLLYYAAFLQLTCRQGVFSTAPVHTHNLVAFLNNRSIINRMILGSDNVHFLYRTRRINCTILYAQRCVFYIRKSCNKWRIAISHTCAVDAMV